MKRRTTICFACASLLVANLGLAAVFSACRNAESEAELRNVIVMIADGWGYNHIIAASYYEYGKDGVQDYEEFPTKTAMSTYMDSDGYDTNQAWSNFDYVKTGYTDSAAAATAMSTGVKTYDGAIGVDINRNPVKHTLEYAEELGKATGVVTSVQFSHATPAGFVAHNVSRNNYLGIANEMIYDSAIDVIMGGGNPDYDADGNPSTFIPYRYVGGTTTWADLTDADGAIGADADGDGTADSWTLIQTRAEFQTLMTGDTPARVIGVPQVYQTLQQGRSGDPNADPYVVPLTETVPTLEEMTVAALNILDNDEDGFFLMIEGGAVDWASHGNQSGRVIEEMIGFHNAVKAVVEWVKQSSNWDETLVIVTGDHETGYLTGPGSNPTWEAIVNNGAGNLPGMEWHSGSHTNSLIPFFANGDSARLFEAYAEESDTVRGHYIDNTDIAAVVFHVLTNDNSDYIKDDD